MNEPHPSQEAEGPDYVIGTATKAKKGRKQKEKKQLNIDEFKAQGKSAGRGRGAGGRGGRGRGGDRNGAVLAAVATRSILLMSRNSLPSAKQLNSCARFGIQPRLYRTRA